MSDLGKKRVAHRDELSDLAGARMRFKRSTTFRLNTGSTSAPPILSKVR
jgi:hypothetical protein